MSKDVQDTANAVLGWLDTDIDHHDLVRILERMARTGEISSPTDEEEE